MFAVFLVLLLSLVAVVHSQTLPYVSFMGDILPNHAYVDLTAVDEDHSVECHTDLFTCCTSNRGDHRGDWYFPNGNALANAGGGGDIYKRRGDVKVDLHRRNNAMSPSGIYHCEIETVAVNDDDMNTITGETVYIGLYPPNEGMAHSHINKKRIFEVVVLQNMASL